MRRRALLAGTCVGLFGLVPLEAQVHLPLGNLPTDEVVDVEREKGTHDLVLEHLVQGAGYSYSIETTYKAVAPPAVPSEDDEDEGEDAALNALDECKVDVEAYRDKLGEKTTEEEVESHNRSTLGSATDDCREQVEQAIQEYTTITVKDVVPVRHKFVTEIVVRRSRGEEERTWTAQVSTGPGAAWVTMPVLAAVLDEGEEWFSRASPLTGEDGTAIERYVLVREDEGLDLRPGVGVGFFLVPESQRERNFFGQSFMAGFGLNDSSTPLLGMVGWGLLFGDHVSMTLGVSSTWERQLLRRYRGEESISDNLTNDQLTGEELVFRPFFGIGIDFNGFDLSSGKKAAPAAGDD